MFCNICIFGIINISDADLIENGKTEKISCKKKQPKGKIVAVSSAIKPSDISILLVYLGR